MDGDDGVMEAFIQKVLNGSTIEQGLLAAKVRHQLRRGAIPIGPPPTMGAEWMISDGLKAKGVEIDIFNIPSPHCIEQHLPQGREPTRDELVDAWILCTSR